MARLSKRKKSWGGQFQPDRSYALDEALGLVRKNATCKFKESVECSFDLGVDPTKSDQIVRGASVLPHGLGKKVRVAVFVGDDQAGIAKEAGADKVGMEELAEEIKSGAIDFDVLIATPASMKLVGRLGQILGPKGLMPNPKTGTVTTDVAQAVKNAKSGQVRFRADKGGIVNCSVGKADFKLSHLRENIVCVLEELTRLKPSSAKGIYIKKLSVCSTMGPGVRVDLATVK